MYWLIFVILTIALLGFADMADKKQRTLALIVSWVLLSLTAGLRNVGGLEDDYAIYLAHYTGETGPVLASYFEPGYNLLVWLGNLLGLSYNGFLFFYSSIVLFFFVRIVFKRSKAPMLSILIYMATYFLFYNMVLNRQMAAVVAVLYGIYHIIDKKPWKFLAAMLIAVSFHYSAVAVLLTYPILRYLKIDKYTVGITVAATLLIMVTGINNIIIDLVSMGGNPLASRMSAYLLKSLNFQVNKMEYAKIALMIPAIIWVYPRIKDSFESQVLIKSYIIFCVFLALFSHLEIMVRVGMYFDLAIIFLIPIIISRIKMVFSTKIIIYLLFAIFTVFSFLYRVNNFSGGEFLQYNFFFLQ